METKKNLGTSLRTLTARILKKKGMDKSLVHHCRWIFEILSSCLYPKKKMKALHDSISLRSMILQCNN